MSRIKFSFLLIIVIIIAIVGVSIIIPDVFFSESYSGVIVDDDWTPAVTKTPTQTITASFTLTPQKSATPAASSTPTISTNCVYPSKYWGAHPELWLEMLVGNTMYSKDDIRVVFSIPSPGTHNILLTQLYIANLNIFSGADPIAIQDVLGEANEWLQKYMPYKQLPEEDRLIGIQLAQTLTEFNSGLKGPGFCPPYESLTVTPMTIIEPTKTPSSTATSTATSIATRVFVTLEPTATASKTKKPDKDPEPTDPPRPTKEPEPTDPPPPTEPPPPKPTDAPPEDTPEPTDPPKPTDAP